jgi:uncharacterized RDD family membrane protein YckC
MTYPNWSDNPGNPGQGNPGNPGPGYQGNPGPGYPGGGYPPSQGPSYPPNSGQPYPGQPYQGQPYQGQAYQGQTYPANTGVPAAGYQTGAAPGYPAGYPGSGYQVLPTTAYSEWSTRVLAYLVDLAPVAGVWIVVTIFGDLIGNLAFALSLDLITFAVTIAYIGYNRWILGGQGQSLGKQRLKIKLVSEETWQPIGTMDAFVRDLCHALDGTCFCLGFLFPLWDAKRQTFADKIVKTVVLPA